MTNTNHLIVVITNDKNLFSLIKTQLEKTGYQVPDSIPAKESVDLILKTQPHIVLLDSELTDNKTGLAFCKEVRDKGFKNSIIMMTGKSEDQDLDKIAAYNVGVSDYITKPLNMDVLDALLTLKTKAFEQQTAIRYFGDREHHSQTSLLIKGGKKIALTTLENRILRLFIENAGAEIKRETLMKEVWGYTQLVNTRTLDMHIARLRKKVEDDGDNKPRFIITVRGKGYKFQQGKSS